MTTNESFKIEVWLSKEGYESKPTPIDYQRMSWVHTTLTVSEFIDRISKGYSYCHIYYGNRRIKSEFHFSQVISIDVDDTETSLQSFLDSCELKPTFAYETFSNGKDGLYSYRLVYIFKERLNAGQFECAYNKIVSLTDLIETKDHCGRVLTQLMNGTTSQAYIYSSNIIYSIETDIIIDNNTDNHEIDITNINYNQQENALKTNSKSNLNLKSNSRVNSNFNNNYNNIFNNKKQYKSKEPFCKNYSYHIEEPLSILMRDRKEFLDFYHQIFKKLIRWSPLEYNDAGYCVVPTGHLKLFERFTYRNGRYVVDRFKDGERRRNRLYIDGCIMRKIKPGVTFLELLYNLVHRVYHYYDNSDGILSNELII